MFSADAYRRRLQELEQGRRAHTRTSAPLDLRWEWLELCRVEAREALAKYLAATDEWRARR
jgi:hypothetical protein